MLKRLALSALLATSLFGAGTCDGGSSGTAPTITKITAPSPQVPNLDGWVIHIRCIADAADGSYPNTTLPQAGGGIENTDGLYFYQLVTNPGSPAPTDNYDITAIATNTGLDLLGGNGANRDTSTTETAAPATLSTVFLGPVSFRTSGNSVNSAVFEADLYLLRTGALRASSGSSGGVSSLAATSPLTTTGATGDITIACATCLTSAAPIDATYITQTANATLTNEQAIGALSTGLMKVTTTTGAVTSVVPGTGVETWITTPTTANLATALGATPVYGGNNCGTATYIPYVTSAGVVMCSITSVYDATNFRISVGDRVGNPSGQVSIGSATSGYGGLWMGSAAPSFSNYSLLGNGAFTYINSPAGGTIQFNINNANLETISATLHTSTIPISAPAYRTATNCADAAGAAACGSAAAGAFVIDAAGTSTVVSTTAVTATSRIFVFFDSSLSTELGITCNTNVPSLYGVSARTAATSFTLSATASVTNPACFSYFLMN